MHSLRHRPFVRDTLDSGIILSAMEGCAELGSFWGGAIPITFLVS